MSTITIICASLVALEHLYIFYLETIITTSSKTAKVFGMSLEELSRPSVKTLFKNQGVYNLLLALMLFYSLLTGNRELVTLVTLFVISVASYGALSSHPKILLLQGGPAIATLLSLLILG